MIENKEYDHLGLIQHILGLADSNVITEEEAMESIRNTFHVRDGGMRQRTVMILTETHEQAYHLFEWLRKELLAKYKYEGEKNRYENREDIRPDQFWVDGFSRTFLASTTEFRQQVDFSAYRPWSYEEVRRMEEDFFRRDEDSPII